MARIVGSDKGIHSPEFHKKKTREKNLKIALAILVLVIVVGVPVYLARTSRFLIAHIDLRGNSVTNNEDIERIVASNLSGSYLWIFPRSNAALYPKDIIRKDLMTNIPRLRSVEFELEGATLLHITVEERTPAVLYCADVTVPASPAECYFADESGTIFSQAPAFSGDVYLTYGRIAPFEFPMGQNILPADEFARTRSFVKEMNALGIFPRVFLIAGDEYHLLLSNGAKVLVNRKDNLGEIYSNLEAFFSDASIRKESNFLDRILYIDLRFDNKVFYKFRDEA